MRNYSEGSVFHRNILKLDAYKVFRDRLIREAGEALKLGFCKGTEVYLDHLQEDLRVLTNMIEEIQSL